ncbi:MAG TPA: hypothetical protein PKC69_11630 [Chitinophagaceae bacterium]|nr:hypothetical protein [Chitinophagaceae bacterium]
MRLIIAFAALTFVLASCGKMQEPVFHHIEKVEMGKLGLTATEATLHLKYYNPNNFRAKLKSAEGEAWMDSLYLGHFVVDTLINVPPRSDFFVPVRLTLDMKQVIQHSLNAFNKEQVKIRINGNARAGRSGFYKTFPIHYEGLQNLQQLFIR